MIDPRIRDELLAEHSRLLTEGQLLNPALLKESYARFRERFGSAALAGLAGEELLNQMHRHGNRDSLVYWLEFKDDEDLPGVFGSIAGGSALKFGVFWSQEKAAWTTGTPQAMRTISTDQAVAIATRHRDQFLAGARILDAMPADAGAAEYELLQQRMDSEAPDVSRLAWGHKYFSLLYPERLDDYHNEDYQRYHLIRLLQPLPQPGGRYRMALPFVELARELGWPLNHLTSVLNLRNGRPRTVWRIGTRVEGEDAWPTMRDHGIVAIGWSKVGDLSGPEAGRACRDALRERLVATYYPEPSKAAMASRNAGALCRFAQSMVAGDLVLACDGMTVRGIGRVAPVPYRYDPNLMPSAPHQRGVEWLSLGDWTLPVPEGSQTAVVKLGIHAENLIAIEQRLLDAAGDAPLVPVPDPVPRVAARLDGIGGEIQAILDRKGQVILYGPPGTGKTYHARRTARDLAGLAAFGRPYAALSAPEQREIDGSDAGPGLVRACTFHPAYGYEDFLEGYRPMQGVGGHLAFERRDGIFKRLCADAAARPDRRFLLIIDEINRGDVPRIFGELLTLLEKDKRGQAVHLPLTGETFTVPPNLFVIGTMNTADRSIALLDTALRRRFGFVELMPDMRVLSNVVIAESIPLDAWLAALNQRILEHVGRDARNFQIGHAYLLGDGRPISTFESFTRVLAEDIVPLLEEYCYDDYETLRRILGHGLVDLSRQRVRRELFGGDRREELIAALLEPTPELSTRADVTEREPETDPDENDDAADHPASDGASP